MYLMAYRCRLSSFAIMLSLTREEWFLTGEGVPGFSVFTILVNLVIGSSHVLLLLLITDNEGCTACTDSVARVLYQSREEDARHQVSLFDVRFPADLIENILCPWIVFQFHNEASRDSCFAKLFRWPTDR